MADMGVMRRAVLILAVLALTDPVAASRLFNDAASDNLLATYTDAGNPRFFVAWFKPDDDNDANQGIIGMGNTSSASPYRYMLAQWNGPNTLSMQFHDSPCTETAQSSSTLSLNVWQHGCGGGSSAASETKILLNGANKGTAGFCGGTTSTHIGIGQRTRSTQDQRFSGKIAHAAVYNAYLSDQECLALAQGVSPLRVRRTALQGYWPLWGLNSPEINYSASGSQLTVNGAAASDDNPPMVPTPLSAMIEEDGIIPWTLPWFRKQFFKDKWHYVGLMAE